MDPIRFAINRPVTISVLALMLVMFGLIALGAIPIQLTPTIDRPVVTVTTVWPGRSPEEVVEEIAKEQERRLKNVSNLRTMISTSREGQCEITLEFYLGSDLTRALQEVSDALRQVPEYPEDVDEPVITSSEGAAEGAIAWMIIDLDPAKAADHPNFDISTIHDAVDREVRPFLERIDGVAAVNVYGGRAREVQVLVDPVALAARGLSHADVVRALRAENTNESAGTIAEGKRDYRVRLVGQYESPEEILSTVLAYRDGRPVFVRDVGTVEMGHVKARGFVRSMGVPCLAMNIIRQSGSNVMAIMPEVRKRIEEVRREILPRLDPVAGKDLRLRQVYDETTYITSAIDRVLTNLWVGGSLAVGVLLGFLRSVRSTLIIAVAIPVSVIGTFLVMAASGRTINVVSLAGLAFSTGMVVDNAIVVLENIERRRALGEDPLLAAYRGAREVWTAILAGTLTTVAVFVPILTVREEVGQLFFDLSLAMAVSVAMSLIVAVTVIPSAEGVLARLVGTGRKDGRITRLFGVADAAARFAAWYARRLRSLMEGRAGAVARPAVVVVLTGACIWGAWSLMPPVDYLPAGNQNLVFGGMLVPPGLSLEQLHTYADGIDSKVGAYLVRPGDPPDKVATLPPIQGPFGPPMKPVGVSNYFVGAFGGTIFAGAISADPDRVIPVGVLLTGAMNGMPDAFGFAQQTSIFGRGARGGNSIDVEVSGPRLESVLNAAGMMLRLSRMHFGQYVRPAPSNFDKLQPEWELHLTQEGRELGLRTADLGVPVRSLFDGAFAGEFRLADRNVDIMVLPSGGRLERKEQLPEVPVATPAGKVVPLGTAARIVPGRSPQEIRRFEELPSVVISITPSQGQTLEEAMAKIEQEIIGLTRAAGLLDPTMRVRMEGTAAKLDDVRASLFGRAPTGAKGAWRRGLQAGAWVLTAAGLIGAVYVLAKARRRGVAGGLYGAIGVVLLALVAGGVLLGLSERPNLATARMVWAVLITYFLMCALFESFVSPLVIMLSVPPAVLGGIVGLRLVHEWTMRNPDIAPQQLDTLTMIGFVILIGTVVNNAILIVEQSLNFMNPAKFGSDEPALPVHVAIAESVRTRLRPIFMTALTTVAGGLPLVLRPGSGSEMYRGLGAVVVGGLLTATVFTAVVIPLAFSLVADMRDAFWRAVGKADAERAPGPLAQAAS